MKLGFVRLISHAALPVRYAHCIHGGSITELVNYSYHRGLTSGMEGSFTAGGNHLMLYYFIVSFLLFSGILLQCNTPVRRDDWTIDFGVCMAKILIRLICWHFSFRLVRWHVVIHSLYSTEIWNRDCSRLMRIGLLYSSWWYSHSLIVI